MGGMLVTAVAFIVWGFLAPRFRQAATRVGNLQPDSGGRSVEEEDTTCNAHIRESCSTGTVQTLGFLAVVDRCSAVPLLDAIPAVGRDARSDPRGRQADDRLPGRRPAVLVRATASGAADRLLRRAVPEGGGRGQNRARHCRPGRRMGAGHRGRSLRRGRAGQGRPAVRRRYRDAGETQGGVVLDPDLSRRDRGDAQGGCAARRCRTCLPAGRRQARSGAARRRRSWRQDLLGRSRARQGRTGCRAA